MEGHKSESNYELQSENRGWKEVESQLGKGGLRYRCGKGSRKARESPEKITKEAFEGLLGDTSGQKSPR